MRIIAGTAKGRRLVAPEGLDVRPTSDRVREAVFNSLYSDGGVDGASVVDLFAGTGAYGLEALSRGAASAVFVERARRSVAAIESNIETLDMADRSTVVATDATSWVDRGRPVDLAFIDPPYDFEPWADLLERVAAGRCVVESDREVEVPPRWKVVRSRRYGGTVVTLLRDPEIAP